MGRNRGHVLQGGGKGSGRGQAPPLPYNDFTASDPRWALEPPYEPQLQETGTGLAPPEKVKVPLLTQGILEMVTGTD